MILKLCHRFGERWLEPFGSVVGPAFDPATNDVESLVEIDRSGRRGCAESYFGLEEGLENLLGRPVDLATPDSVENPRVLASSAASRRLLHAA